MNNNQMNFGEGPFPSRAEVRMNTLTPVEASTEPQNFGLQTQAQRSSSEAAGRFFQNLYTKEAEAQKQRLQEALTSSSSSSSSSSSGRISPFTMGYSIQPQKKLGGPHQVSMSQARINRTTQEAKEILRNAYNKNRALNNSEKGRLEEIVMMMEGEKRNTKGKLNIGIKSMLQKILKNKGTVKQILKNKSKLEGGKRKGTRKQKRLIRKTRKH